MFVTNLIQDPRAVALLDIRIKRVNDVLENAMSKRMAIEGVLSDKPMQAKSLIFMRYVTVWLLRIATESNYTPSQTIKYDYKFSRDFYDR